MQTLKYIFFLLILYTENLQAQQKIDWKKIYISDFKEDSVQSFNNPEVQDHIIYPIQQSNANLEIRLHVFPLVSSQGTIWTLKFFRDTLIAEKYNFMYYSWRYADPYEFIGKDKFGQDIGRRITKFRVNSSGKNILDSLLISKIFIIETYNSFLQFIKSNKTGLNKPEEDCLHCKPTYCEIKFGNKTRNFFLFPDPVGYFKSNPNIEYFKNTIVFEKILNTIFNPQNQILCPLKHNL